MSVTIFIVMPGSVMLNVIMLTVKAPFSEPDNFSEDFFLNEIHLLETIFD
jgi:hypothetical protein